MNPITNRAECQSCHDPMGASDGAGGTVGRLGRLPGAALCYSCHQATGPAATNLAALAYKPEAGIRSLVVAYGGGAQTREFGQLHLYTRLTTATASLIGPREYASGGEIGRVAAGDVNGDGKNELVLSRTNSSVVSVLSPSAFSGLVEFPGNQTLLAPATFVGVGDVMDDTQNLREVVTADAATVRVYRWNTSLLRLDPVAALSVPNGQITGLAVGPIIGGAHSDIAVTTDADKLVVMTGSGASLVQSGEYSTRSGPVGPSVKDIDGDGHGEIAVANSGESNPVLSVYDYVGTEVRSGGTSLDASATATAIGNILPGVTLAGTSGD